MKYALVLGTRPEIIKLSPIIRQLVRTNQQWVLIHTNQHYSANMDEIFFSELALPKPQYNLHVGSGSHTNQLAQMMLKLEPILERERPDVVLVQGDTNSVLAGGLVAAKLNIPVAHIEAGLRSYDRQMPEEVNRIIVDHIADYLFCPTADAAQTLRQEGLPKNRIFTSGNTIVQAVYENLQLARQQVKLPLPEHYILLTLHRPSNVDDRHRLAIILQSLRQISQELHRPVIFPIHPRTKKQITEFGLSLAGLDVWEPQGYLAFLTLENQADIIVTDSGGLQEEACILRVPCLTLRLNTERPETLAVGANLLAGQTGPEIKENFYKMFARPRVWTNPYGRGNISQRILTKITK